MFVDWWALSVLPDEGYLGGGFEKGSAFMIFLEISAILCHRTSVVVKWASTPLTNTSIWARDLDAGKKDCGSDDFLRADIMSEKLTHASVDAAILKTDGLYFQSTLSRYWDLVGHSMMIEGTIMAFLMMMTTFECLARFFPEWNIMFPRAQVIWRLA